MLNDEKDVVQKSKRKKRFYSDNMKDSPEDMRFLSRATFEPKVLAN